MRAQWEQVLVHKEVPMKVLVNLYTDMGPGQLLHVGSIQYQQKWISGNILMQNHRQQYT